VAASIEIYNAWRFYSGNRMHQRRVRHSRAGYLPGRIHHAAREYRGQFRHSRCMVFPAAHASGAYTHALHRYTKRLKNASVLIQTLGERCRPLTGTHTSIRACTLTGCPARYTSYKTRAKCCGLSVKREAFPKVYAFLSCVPSLPGSGIYQARGAGLGWKKPTGSRIAQRFAYLTYG
jgi:hypothetical protein